jgi:flagellar motor component MotA
MSAAFSVQSMKEPDTETLKKAVRFFELYGKTLWLTGIISVIIGVMNMLQNLENASELGPNFALALVSIFYCCVMHVLVILPSMMFIKKHLNE